MSEWPGSRAVGSSPGGPVDRRARLATGLAFRTAIRHCETVSERWFLKIDGIVGDSIDANHKGEIDVLSWSWGVTHAGGGAGPGGGGGGAGKASFQDFHFVSRISKASPALFLSS